MTCLGGAAPAGGSQWKAPQESCAHACASAIPPGSRPPLAILSLKAPTLSVYKLASHSPLHELSPSAALNLSVSVLGSCSVTSPRPVSFF